MNANRVILEQRVNGLIVDGKFKPSVYVDPKLWTTEKEWPLGTELRYFGKRYIYYHQVPPVLSRE